jgi:flagellar biosynthetic protein FliR
MNFFLGEIVDRFYGFIWPMLRCSSAFLLAPPFALAAFSLRLRILFSVVLAWIVFPLYDWPRIDPVSAQGLLAISNELLIGVSMGLILQVVVAAMVVAGQAISASMGLSMANMIDPNVGNVPVISQLFIILGILVFLGFGGHGILLSIILESFQTLPVGKDFSQGQLIESILRWSSMMFLGGVLLSLPILGTLLFINAGLGVVTRAAPSLNIFAVGFPALMISGFFVLWLSSEGIASRMQWLWLQGIAMIRSTVLG